MNIMIKHEQRDSISFSPKPEFISVDPSATFNISSSKIELEESGRDVADSWDKIILV